MYRVKTVTGEDFLMLTEKFMFTGAKEKQLGAVLWLPDFEPLGVVQITHGMTEHMGRWETLAKSLTDSGFAVCGFDLRGHGNDVVVKDVAVFGEEDWDAALEDMHLLFTLLQEKFPGLPHLMLGFSLGSFLLREYLGIYPDKTSGAAILGTGSQNGVLLGLLQKLVKTQIGKVGWMGSTPLISKLSFETYNRKFSPNRTRADWLCSDGEQLDSYLADPLCRSSISAGLFWHLLGSMRCGAEGCKNWDKNLPVLLLSGADDPVGDMGKGVKAVAAQLRSGEMERVELQLVPKARHDLLHEEKSGAAAKAREILCNWATDIVKKS